MQQQQFCNTVLLLQHQGKVLDGPDGEFILQSENNVLEWRKTNRSDPPQTNMFQSNLLMADGQIW